MVIFHQCVYAKTIILILLFTRMLIITSAIVCLLGVILFLYFYQKMSIPLRIWFPICLRHVVPINFLVISLGLGLWYKVCQQDIRGWQLQGQRDVIPTSKHGTEKNHSPLLFHKDTAIHMRGPKIVSHLWITQWQHTSTRLQIEGRRIWHRDWAV